MMYAAGVAMTIKVHYVPDYIFPQVRIQDQTQLLRQLSGVLSEYNVVLAVT